MNIGLAASAILAVLTSSPAWAQERVRSGRELFQNCASCHATPDPALKADRRWIEMVQETA